MSSLTAARIRGLLPSRPILGKALFNAGVFFGFLGLARLFLTAYFPLDESRAGGPGDFQPYVAIDWFVGHTLLTYGELPLWNPFIRTGVPMIGDAYVSMFNPLVFGPLVVFGPVNGAKLAVMGATAMAGIGQYFLGRVLGHNRVISLAGGSIGLASGSLHVPIATGFAFGATMQHAWIAIVFASFLMVLREGRFRWIAICGASNALMFHSGNLYYWIAVNLILLILITGVLINVSVGNGHLTVSFKKRAALACLGMCALTFLLMAPHLLPLLELIPYTEKPIDVTRGGSMPFLVTLFGFVVPDRQFWANGLFGASPLGWAIHFSYIGATCLLFLTGVVAKLMFGSGRRLLAVLCIAFFTAIGLASINQNMFRIILDIVPFFQLFRHWGTVVAVASVLLIACLMDGAQWWWDWVNDRRSWFARHAPAIQLARPASSAGLTPRPISLGRFGGLGLLIMLLIFTVLDPWHNNSGIVNTPPWNSGEDQVFGWVKGQQPGAVLIYAHNLIYSHASVGQLKAGLSAVDSVWPFKLRPGRVPTKDVLTVAPAYFTTFPNSPPPDGMTLLQNFPSGSIFAAPKGLPFAWTSGDRHIPYGDLAAGASAVELGTVVEARAIFDGPNRIRVTVSDRRPRVDDRVESLRLVVMQGWMPGWSAVNSSGAKLEVTNAGEFLSVVGVALGETILFRYLPPSFVFGGVLGVLGVGLAMTMVTLPTRAQNLIETRASRWLVKLNKRVLEPQPGREDVLRGEHRTRFPVPVPPRPDDPSGYATEMNEEFGRSSGIR